MIQRYTVHRCDINTHEKSGDVVDVVLYSDVAALTATIKRTDDIILTLTDDNEKQAERIAALTATLSELKQALRIAALAIYNFQNR